ncbi:Uncharacterised protein [Haemophilus influenzae]|uniref:ANR family transcriptional regulator n=1 Tax=Haemophilus influenzae TaxID=727 RepID=UPI0007666890|nr:ANR family transcriptional regulator [Haemophilus influenzae]AWP55684.1 hypothetical protein DLK00_05510 [Haemophilus influenzae]MCK8943113.1 ANR family transcriptional regulator [Haemophilus influenzae]MCK8948592.1 ANR family transcriptional regulator [Haemophilus influenzae]PRI71737.1 hypothetical protein BVZ93_01643 [Haemophilus influenzae]PRJ95016.1 hypothetical protein BV172_01152 [Haemophilus influenzae]
MNKNINKFDRFKYYSEQAANSERRGELQGAKAQWAIAELNAPNARNQEWCKHRAAFCERVLRKPF